MPATIMTATIDGIDCLFIRTDPNIVMVEKNTINLSNLHVRLAHYLIYSLCLFHSGFKK